MIEETCKYIYYTSSSSSTTMCVKHSTTQYIKQFESIALSRVSLYIKCPEINTIGLYNAGGFQNLQFKGNIINDDYRWLIKDTLYSFKVILAEVKVLKYSVNINQKLWSKSLPYCKTKDPNNELFLSLFREFIFIICSSSNLIYKFNGDTGNILAQYSLDNGVVKAFKCSIQFLFILYGDATIVQYTHEFKYVYTYSIKDTKTPKYNTLKVDYDYLFCVLCTGSLSVKDFHSPVIYQWGIQDYSQTSFQVFF